MAKNLVNKVKVLIITSTIDCTVDYIIERYEKNVEFYRLNVDEFGKYEIDIGDNNHWCISYSNWMIKKEDVFSIYYRKPSLPDLNEFEKKYHNMISRDIIGIINGIVDDFDGKALTKPSILRKTENKIFQLLYAKKKNLLIPDSFIGNSLNRSTSFLNKKSIIKPITTGKVISQNNTEIYQTNYLRDLEDDISLTPIYLQEYMDKKYEVRLTIINGSLFPVRIDSKNKLDWRQNYDELAYSIIECPDKIKTQCLKLMKHFKLQFGAFDFIVNKKEEWIFLEINPNGQWLWLEQTLHLAISQKIVDYLTSEEKVKK